MREWIVYADSPTRAMERYKLGELVRCRDCAHARDGRDGIACGLLGFNAEDGGFCRWGERKVDADGHR